MQRIAIMGFPHSGTSILKRIIGNDGDVFEYPYETNAITEPMLAEASAAAKRAIVVKDINFPWMPSYQIPAETARVVSEFKEFLSANAGCRFIMVIKNPADILGSLNKRFGVLPDAERPAGHSFREWETWAEVFHFFRANPQANLFTVTYEEFFAGGHARLAELFEFLGLAFGPHLLTSDRASLIVDNVTEVPEAEPASRENGAAHGAFRTWQINQPFRDMTGESARFLDAATAALIGASRIAGRLGYADP